MRYESVRGKELRELQRKASSMLWIMRSPGKGHEQQTINICQLSMVNGKCKMKNAEFKMNKVIAK